VIMSRNQLRQDVAVNMLRFFDWAYRNGAVSAEKLAYAPVPQDVVDVLDQRQDGRRRAAMAACAQVKRVLIGGNLAEGI
jgi:hypothetical protein